MLCWLFQMINERHTVVFCMYKNLYTKNQKLFGWLGRARVALKLHCLTNAKQNDRTCLIHWRENPGVPILYQGRRRVWKSVGGDWKMVGVINPLPWLREGKLVCQNRRGRFQRPCYGFSWKLLRLPYSAPTLSLREK